MNYEQLQKLTPKDFKRYSGVHQETFKEMVKIVKAEKILQKNREDQVNCAHQTNS
ncbi:hypothetical protein QUA94_34640 [Microcoleus sp. F8-D2]